MWVCSGMNGCLRAATPKPSFPNHCFEGLEKEKASVQQRYGIALEEFIPAQTFPFSGCISQILCGFVHIQLLKKRTETRNQSWDVMCWKANCNSLLVCSAAEWQRIAAGILRFCFHWKREWQTAEITKVIFFKHSIYWITSQIQSLTFSDFSTHLFTFSANGLLPSGSWRSTEKSGLYFMACSQWTCSISFRDKFCFYNFHLGKVIKGSLRVDDLIWGWKLIHAGHTTLLTEVSSWLNDPGYTAKLLWRCMIVQGWNTTIFLFLHEIPMHDENCLNQWTWFRVCSLVILLLNDVQKLGVSSIQHELQLEVKQTPFLT